MHGLENFALELEECEACGDATAYPDVEHAHRHLQHHYLGPRDEMQLYHWIMPTSERKLRKRNSNAIKVIETLNWRVIELLVKCAEIRNGVANQENKMPGYFLLPSALVKTAEKIFKFIYTAQCVVRFSFTPSHADASTLLPSPNEFHQNLVLADHYGLAATRLLATTEKELLLMAHTNSRETVAAPAHLHLTLPTTLALGLWLLADRDIKPEKGLLELYRNHLSSLVRHDDPFELLAKTLNNEANSVN